jgi:hypothetical protein
MEKEKIEKEEIVLVDKRADILNLGELTKRDITTLTNDDISKVLSYSSGLEKWLEGIKTLSASKLMKGEKIKGYKLVEGRGVRKIEDETKAVELLTQEGYKIEDITTTKLLGVGELEKTLGAVKFNALLGGVIVKSVGKPTLVDESDKREELKPLKTYEDTGIVF